LNEIPVSFLLSSLVFAQQTKFVDFKSVSGQLTLEAKREIYCGFGALLVGGETQLIP
jgi:hypothetical protein